MKCPYTLEEIETVIACLGDDSNMLRRKDDYEEMSDNMDRAEAMLIYFMSELSEATP